MGIFKDQSLRLIREKWRDPNVLAEELYAILNSDKPIVIDSPIEITNNTDGPAITINNNREGDTIQINNQPQPPIQLPNYPPVTIPDFPSIPDTATIDNRGRGPGDGGGGGDGGDGEPSVFPGQITSGTADTYEVDVYENGLGEGAVSRSVKQLQIAGDAEIPSGTWSVIGKVGEEYFMQVPVWLDN